MTPHDTNARADSAPGDLPEAGAPERDKIDLVAGAIFDALSESDPDAMVWGDPRDPEITSTETEGTFDLRLVADRVLRAIGC
jgi:hypothetical protein